MGRRKKEKTVIHSIRINENMKNFLSSLDNTNKFVLQLLLESEEFKKYQIQKSSLDNTATLF
jgi:hypothetical protein